MSKPGRLDVCLHATPVVHLVSVFVKDSEAGLTALANTTHSRNEGRRAAATPVPSTPHGVTLRYPQPIQRKLALA